MCRMYGGDSEMLLLRGNHKLASFTLVEDWIYALIRIKQSLGRIAMCLRRRSPSMPGASIAQRDAGLCTVTHAGGAAASLRTRDG